MGKWRVFVTVDASVVLEVEADTEEQAKEAAMDEVGSPCLCHHCSYKIELGDPMEAIEAIKIDDEEGGM